MINLKNKKSVLMSSIFYIFMILVFVAIVYYGVKNVFFIEEEFSNKEKIDNREKIKKNLILCYEPLNIGNVKTITTQKKFFNSFLTVSNSSYKTLFLDFEFSDREIFLEEVDIITKSNDNILLISFETDNKKKIFKYVIVDSFETFVRKNSFVYDFSINSNVNLRIEC